MLCLWFIFLLVTHVSRGFVRKNLYKTEFKIPKDDKHPEVFTAVLTSDCEAGKIRFDYVCTNVGGSYDKFTGVFTARTKGIYAFYWTAISAFRFVKTELFLNDDVVGAALSDLIPDSQFMQDEVANSATLSLHPGDKVCIMSNNTLLPGSVFSGNRIPFVKNPTAFYARSGNQIVNDDAFTQFEEILLNTRGDFDGTTFTPSSDGLYVFTASGSTFSQEIDLDIDLNEGTLFSPDEEFNDDSAIYVKSVSNTVVLRLEQQTIDRVNIEIEGDPTDSVPIDEKSIFSGYKHLDGYGYHASAITVTTVGLINFNCSLGCTVFSEDPTVILDVNKNFNVKTGEFTALKSGLYGIAVSIESRNIASNYSIEISDVEVFSGRTNGPLILPDSGVFADNFSKRVVFQYLSAGDVVKVTLTGTYRTGSSLSIWKLHD